MAQTPGGPNKRPFQDIKTTSRQAGQFPGIGVTLSSYSRPSADSPASTAVNPPKKRRLPKLTLKRTFVSLLLILVVAGGIFGGQIASDLHKIFGGNIFSYIAALFHQDKLKVEDQGRVNILLAGWQGNEADEGALTDSIMVVSLDTKNNKAFLLSIPRDLWVDIPGNGHEKINAANTNSNFSQPGYPSGGMGQLEQIVQSDIGIP